MIVSYNKLNEFVDLNNISPYELADILTNAGIEVDSVHPLAQGSDLVIGFVKKVEKHPNSDSLYVCQVDVKDEILQIVCGAANVKENTYVIVAKPGCEMEYAKVPVIKKVDLGGVESNGMICSLNELGIPEKFQTKEQIDGIEVLDKPYNVGEEALSQLGFDDYIFDLDLTPNRSDLYSIYALAIEVGGLLKTKVKEVNLNVETDKETDFQIEIEDEACLSYGLFEFNDLEVAKVSYQMKNELIALNFKDRFNLVDYANLAMVISGNPIHTFDADKLKSKTITIKKGIETDNFLALDDKYYKIIKDDLLIMCGDEIIGIAGVIGSKSSAVDENTKNLIVESAVFSHVSIRKTSKRLDLFTEASTRFNKIINPYTSEFAIAILEELLNKKCDAVRKVNYPVYKPVEIEVKTSKISRVLGIDIPVETSIQILKDLMFEVEYHDDSLFVKPPSYRKDVTIREDVIEEIIRVYGYDKIATTMPTQKIVYNKLSSKFLLDKYTKDALVGLGLREIITYQLYSKEKLDNFSIEQEYMQLQNPLNKEREYFRDNPIIGMIEAIQYNNSYKHMDLALFEISDVFFQNKPHTFLTIGLSGYYESNLWQKQTKKADFYLLKGIILEWLEKIGFSYGRVLIKPIEKDHPFLHPGKAAYISVNNKDIGIFGQLHPAIIDKFKLKETYIANINLTQLDNFVGRVNKYKPISQFPVVSRDLSLVVPNKVNAEDIVKLIRKGNSKLIKEVDIFDVYYGQELLENHYSLSLTLKISDDKKTLDEETISQVVNTILTSLNTKYKITLRS